MAAKKKRTRSAPGKKKPASSSFSRIKVLFWSVLFGLTVGSLALAFVLLKTMPFESVPGWKSGPVSPPVISRKQAAPTPRAAAHPKKVDKAPPVRRQIRTYEEDPSESLESKIREVDMAILQAALQCSIPSRGLRHTGVEQRSKAGQSYHFQTITIDPTADLKRLGKTLSTTLTALVDGAVMTSPGKNSRELRITVDGFPTHTLLPAIQTPPPRPASPPKGALAIVIDDMGQHVREGDVLAGLSVPVTFSVLPYNEHAREVAELAYRNGLEVLIHLPMEPRGYPETANPGPGALFTSMPPKTIRTLVNRAAERIPHATGVNNHMGSRFTEYGRGMDTVLAELAVRRLFFLDSMTTSRSQGRTASRRAHVPYI